MYNIKTKDKTKKDIEKLIEKYHKDFYKFFSKIREKDLELYFNTPTNELYINTKLLKALDKIENGLIDIENYYKEV